MRFLSALRPLQWTKNLLCFVPLVFTASFPRPAAWRGAVLAFAAFCLLSSASYLANDIHDRETDRADPRTRNRPVARGDLSAGAAAGLSGVLAAAGLFVAHAAGALGVAVAFLVLQALYTFAARRAPGWDVVLVGCTFVLRAMGGAEAIAVPTSPWLFAVAFLVACRIALAKRSAEARAGVARPFRAAIPAAAWDGFGTAVAGAILATYALYAFSSETASRLAARLPAGTPPLLLTLPFVAYGLFRFEVLVAEGRMGEPERVLLSDPPLFATALAWLGAVVFVLWP